MSKTRVNVVASANRDAWTHPAGKQHKSTLSDRCPATCRMMATGLLTFGQRERGDVAWQQENTATRNQSPDSSEMTGSRGVSTRVQMSGALREDCGSLCGMCPSCVTAPEPAGSPAQRPWTACDALRRRLMVGLLLRCRSLRVLDYLDVVLSVTSWSSFTYARSRRQRSPLARTRCAEAAAAPRGGSAGETPEETVRNIWDWFGGADDSMKLSYLRRLFVRCDSELLRMLANLTNVLLVRLKRGSREFSVSNQDSDSDTEPALMVVPGASRSMSGVSRYCNFISCLPVDLAKRILGLLDQPALSRCKKVCQRWQKLVEEIMEEIKFRKTSQLQLEALMKRSKAIKAPNPTYVNMADVPVPVADHEREEARSADEEVRIFQSAYANIPTRPVKMEERNVYCGAFYTKVLLNKEDPAGVVDHRGGPLIAMSSKNSTVHLVYIVAQTRRLAVMRGHVGTIRALLLCEERGVVITASCDATIRCWNLKSHLCDMVLYGHTLTINCLDVHADTLVSGAKDCLVKVWNLQTGKAFEGLKFRHRGSIQCVRINGTSVYSSCIHGLIKIWDTSKACLLRIIDSHRDSTVRCMFVDQWHFLSGDSSGLVRAWSANCSVKKSLMTFYHPQEVKSVALIYLRVMTGCADGKIRIFNFLTGECLKNIPAEAETSQVLSMHFNENSILMNTTTNVKLYQFGKVFFNNESAPGCRGDARADAGSLTGKSEAKIPPGSAVASPVKHVDGSRVKKPEKTEPLLYSRHPSPTRCQTRVMLRCESAKTSLLQSEKAACRRMEKRGLHHPLRGDTLLLKISAIQRSRHVDEVSSNMERNARLRDAWGPNVMREPLGSDLQRHKPESSSKGRPQTAARLQGPRPAHQRRAKTCPPKI